MNADPNESNPPVPSLAEARWALAELRNSLLSLSIELTDARRELERLLATGAPGRAAPAARDHSPVPVARVVYQPAAPTPTARKAVHRALPLPARPSLQHLQPIRLELARM